MINCFCMFSDYIPLTLDEWIQVDRERREKTKMYRENLITNKKVKRNGKYMSSFENVEILKIQKSV